MIHIIKKFIQYYGQITTIILLTIILIYPVFEMQDREVHLFFRTFDNPFYYYLNKDGILLYYIKYFSWVFIINVFILSLLAIGNKYYNIYKRDRDQKIYNEILEVLVPILLNKDLIKSPDYQKKHLKICQKNKKRKRVSFYILIQIRTSVKGDAYDNALWMSRFFNVEKWITRYIDSPFIHDKIYAAKLILYFNISGYRQKLSKWRLSHNKVLRSIAVAALANSSAGKDLSLLKSYSQNLTVADFNSLLVTISKNGWKSYDYSQLIFSNNPIISAIGFIGASNAKDSSYLSMAKQKLTINNFILSKEIYRYTLSATSDPQVEIEYLNLLKNEDERVIMALSPILLSIKNKEALSSFLQTLIETRPISIKAMAAKMLLEVDVRSLQKYSQTKDLEILSAYKEATDFNQ